MPERQVELPLAAGDKWPPQVEAEVCLVCWLESQAQDVKWCRRRRWPDWLAYVLLVGLQLLSPPLATSPWRDF